MSVIFANISHGNEPYILAASVGAGLGEVVVPDIYPNRQYDILRRWVGKNPRVYLDAEGGDILKKILFGGNYADYVRRVTTHRKDVEDALAQHLKDFEAVSLTGETKRFVTPDVELNVGSPFFTSIPRSFYIFPGLLSEYAARLPHYVSVDGVETFGKLCSETEERHEIIFIPKINSFSYLQREPGRKEVPTPPLKRKGYHNVTLREGIFVNLPGSGVLADELIRVAGNFNVPMYHLPQDSRLPGTSVETHEIIFNKNILAVLARAGWGTLWFCQVAEKPIIAPSWRVTDDPEIYHNNRTVQTKGMGVVYKEFTPEVLQEALAKVDQIKQLNRELYEQFGTLDGISFVQQKIKEAL